MSFRIDVDRVTRILLPDGAWHQVLPGSFSADLNAREATPIAGVAWKERDDAGKQRRVFCPLRSIHAVSYGWE